ncbi:MAG TPA: glycerophosphodiester phosphodiesterase family protein, partial [Candidatus Wallbacteria bacterium]|nr:glycerophosphodiester phosphodiesterase family protein [Candidatus Wallbacteria bacterium]
MKSAYVFIPCLLFILCTSLCAMASEVIGHRGAAFYAPENTLVSIETAWKMGADGVEVDVHMSRDGRIMVIHDDEALRTAGAKLKVAEANSSELRALDAGSWKGPRFSGEKIPFLEEALSTVPPGKKFLIEIKCGTPAVKNIVNIVNMSRKTRQVVFISFKLDVVKMIKKMMPEAGA